MFVVMQDLFNIQQPSSSPTQINIFSGRLVFHNPAIFANGIPSPPKEDIKAKKGDLGHMEQRNEYR